MFSNFNEGQPRQNRYFSKMPVNAFTAVNRAGSAKKLAHQNSYQYAY